MAIDRMLGACLGANDRHYHDSKEKITVGNTVFGDCCMILIEKGKKNGGLLIKDALLTQES
jgi:hypothetical protein